MLERILRLQPNVPCQIALKHMDGLNVASYYGKPQIRFELEGGQLIYLPEPAATKLRCLNPEPGETFGVCKRQNGSRVVWDFWLSPQTEQARAAKEAEQQARETQHAADLTPILQKSIEKVRQIRTGKPIVEAPLLAPTGTDGPLIAPTIPAPLPALAVARKPPARIPFDIALREVLDFTTAALKESGEQWADAAKQDLISTIIIAACNHGLIGCWQRKEAA